MTTRSRHLASWILIAAGALVGCGDDEPAGSGGSGGAGGGSTTAGSGGSGTASTGDAPGVGGSTSASAGGGGAGGEATGGGGEAGGEAVAHPVEIALRTFWPDADPGEAQILINDVDGALLERFHGDELPVVVDVRDGQTVSFLEGDADSWSTIVGARVTPELTTIDWRISGRWVAPPPCEPAEPMWVTFEIPAVEGATQYIVDLGGGSRTTVTEPGPVGIEVRRCAGVETFDAFVKARTPDSILAYDVHRGVPYVPGEAPVIDVVLDDAPREILQLDLTSLAGASEVAAYAWWTTVFPELPFREDEGELSLLETNPPDTLAYAPAVIAPGFGYPYAFARVEFPRDGITCAVSHVSRLGASAEPIALDATALRLPVAADAQGLTWAWDGAGATGDTMHRQWYVPSPDEEEGRELRWILTDDPGAPPRAAVFPELPADLPPDFLRPGGEPQLVLIGHGDVDSVATYADAMARGQEPVEQTSRSRASLPCEQP